MEEHLLFNSRYRLIKEKGRGSFGEVWLACDEQLGMDVAVKMYIALDDRGIEEFKKEYKTAYNLNHPNLLHAHHFDICDRRPFLVMPYCPNSATSLIGNCDNDMLWRFIKDVSSGLSYLHSLDIVHHDIKPDNILITEDGRFVITDFGISTNMRSTLRRNSTRAMNQNSSGGSLPYMGPEMFTSRPESVKATDVWAFGVTLYELITGELPFFGQGGVMMLRGAESPVLDYLDENIVSLVRACLSKETWDRPTAEEIVTMAETGCFIGRKKEEPKKKDEKKTVNFSASGNRVKSFFDNSEQTSSSSEASVLGDATPAKARHWFVNFAIISGTVTALVFVGLGIDLFWNDRWLWGLSGRVLGVLSLVAATGGFLLWKNNRVGFWLITVSELIAGILTGACERYPISVLIFIAILMETVLMMKIKKNGTSAWELTNYRKSGSAYTFVVCISAVAFSVLMFAIPSKLQIEAKGYLPEYQRCVENCLRVVREDDPAVKDLISAKRDFLKLSKYEAEYKYVNSNYDKSSAIRLELESKLRTESEKWSKAASMQRRLGNISKAEEFEKLVTQLGMSAVAPHYSGE